MLWVSSFWGSRGRDGMQGEVVLCGEDCREGEVVGSAEEG